MRHIVAFEDHDPLNESHADKQLVKAGEVAADAMIDALTPEEVEFLADYYAEEGRDAVADQLMNLEEDTMSPKELKFRKIVDKAISYGGIGSLIGILPAAMAGAPALAVALGIASLAGCALKDAAWWKTQGHHYKAQQKHGMANKTIIPRDY